MRAAKLLTPLAAASICGCAQFSSLNWPVNVEGKAVALDAKQRVVISKRSELEKLTVVCAEPSPDALSAYGASVGGTLRQSSGSQMQLATALAEQAASIGLRTQSIQLMRDAMYRACEGYLSGGITRDQFYSLQRRFQNLTLGLLAIEQLTGAVKAEQASLSTNSGASTGASAEAETQALGKARTDADAAKAKVEEARAQLKKDEASHVDATKRLADAKKVLAENKTPTQSDKDVVTAAETAAEAATEARDNQLLVVAREERTLETSTEMVKLAQENLNAARLQVRAFASGTAAFGASGAARAQVTEKVADAVKDIVQKVFDESGKGEGCNGIIGDFRERTQDYLKNPPLMDLLNICLSEKAIDVTSRARREGVPESVLPSVQRPPFATPAPAPPPPPAPK